MGEFRKKVSSISTPRAELLPSDRRQGDSYFSSRPFRVLPNPTITLSKSTLREKLTFCKTLSEFFSYLPFHFN